MEFKFHQRKLCISALLVTSLGLASTADAAKVVYKWSDDDGTIHYTATPPESRGHKALNADGIVVGEQDAPATPEERLARAKQQEAARKLALEESKEKRRSRLLLATYRSEKDIEARLQAVLNNIEGEIKIANRAYESESRLLGILVQRAANLQRQGKAVPPNNAIQIKQQQSKTIEQLANISKLQDNMSNERTSFAQDLARYRSFNRADGS